MANIRQLFCYNQTFIKKTFIIIKQKTLQTNVRRVLVVKKIFVFILFCSVIQDLCLLNLDLNQKRSSQLFQ